MIRWETDSVLWDKTVIVYRSISQVLLKTSLKYPELLTENYFVSGHCSIAVGNMPLK